VVLGLEIKLFCFGQKFKFYRYCEKPELTYLTVFVRNDRY